MTRHAKAAFGQLMFVSRLDAVLLRAAVVVAFHRVQDGEDPTGLSIGRAMFERYCRFFKRHFDVVPLGEIIARLERGQRVDRQLAITFDDGYRDNFVNAAPVLEALGLPATFFVVSRWIGSGVWPWWDRERNVCHRWMTWDEVRDLRARGFEIGAHTLTHPDLGLVQGDAAAAEIGGARMEIERELGAPVGLFAYPYGGASNISESNRTLVRAAGFRCCCSCYGGLTRRGTDPFNLPRVAVTPWYDSPYHFGLELLVRETRVKTGPRTQPCCEISEATGY